MGFKYLVFKKQSLVKSVGISIVHYGDPYEKEKREYESESMRGSAEWRQEGSRIRVRERRRRRTHFAFFCFSITTGFY